MPEWVTVAYHTLIDTVLTSHHWHSASEVELLLLGLGLGLEEVFVFDSKSENRDRAIEAVESVPEVVRVRVRVTALLAQPTDQGSRMGR